MFCTNCGEKLNENVNFCPKCGKKIHPDHAQENGKASENLIVSQNISLEDKDYVDQLLKYYEDNHSFSKKFDENIWDSFKPILEDALDDVRNVMLMQAGEFDKAISTDMLLKESFENNFLTKCLYEATFFAYEVFCFAKGIDHSNVKKLSSISQRAIRKNYNQRNLERIFKSFNTKEEIITQTIRAFCMKQVTNSLNEYQFSETTMKKCLHKAYAYAPYGLIIADLAS